MSSPTDNLRSNCWTQDQLDQARREYLLPRTLGETVQWQKNHSNFDLLQSASSAWPVDYTQLADHPLQVKQFTFKTVAKATNIDFDQIRARLAQDTKDVTCFNVGTGYGVYGNEIEWHHQHGFDRHYRAIKVNQSNYPELIALSAQCNLEKSNVAINYQPSGCTMPRHVDFLDSMWKDFVGDRPDMLNLPYNPITKSPQGYLAIRLMVALTDWVPGHMFGFEHDHWTQWRAGDIIAFDWAHAQHYTANASFLPRAFAKISGIIPCGPHWVFDNINHNTITNL
jgi:hypothetical protein